MAEFIPTEEHMKHVLILLFHLKNTAAESQQELVKTYGEEKALSKEICEYWFQRFENGDFSLEETPDYKSVKRNEKNQQNI